MVKVEIFVKSKNRLTTHWITFALFINKVTLVRESAFTKRDYMIYYEDTRWQKLFFCHQVPS